MNRLVHTKRAFTERRAWKKSERPGQHRAFVREDVAKHVAAHDDIERRRVSDEPHGGRIDELMIEFDI